MKIKAGDRLGISNPDLHGLTEVILLNDRYPESKFKEETDEIGDFALIVEVKEVLGV